MLVATALVIGARPAAAHETWLTPSAFQVPAGETALTIDLTSGSRFPQLDHAIAPERVSAARWRLGGRQQPIADLSTMDKALRLTPRLEGSGIATIWVSLHPKAIDLDAH